MIIKSSHLDFRVVVTTGAGLEADGAIGPRPAADAAASVVVEATATIIVGEKLAEKLSFPLGPPAVKRREN